MPNRLGQRNGILSDGSTAKKKSFFDFHESESTQLLESFHRLSCPPPVLSNMIQPGNVTHLVPRSFDNSSLFFLGCAHQLHFLFEFRQTILCRSIMLMAFIAPIIGKFNFERRFHFSMPSIQEVAVVFSNSQVRQICYVCSLLFKKHLKSSLWSTTSPKSSLFAPTSPSQQPTRLLLSFTTVDKEVTQSCDPRECMNLCTVRIAARRLYYKFTMYGTENE